MTLKGGTRGVKIFWRVSIIRPNGLTWSDKIWYDNTRRSGVFVGVGTPPVPKGRGSSVSSPQNGGSSTYAQTVWPRATRFAVVIHVRTERVARYISSQGGVAPASPILGNPYLRRNGLTHSDEIWCDYTCGAVACFWGQARPRTKGAGPYRPLKMFGTPAPNGLIERRNSVL